MPWRVTTMVSEVPLTNLVCRVRASRSVRFSLSLNARRARETGDDLNDGDGAGGYAHGEDDFSEDDDDVMRSPVSPAPFALCFGLLYLLPRCLCMQLAV